MKLDAKELKDVGVKIVKGTLIECKKCKQQWSPEWSALERRRSLRQ
jgi:hypothetical protein